MAGDSGGVLRASSGLEALLDKVSIVNEVDYFVDCVPASSWRDERQRLAVYQTGIMSSS